MKNKFNVIKVLAHKPLNNPSIRIPEPTYIQVDTSMHMGYVQLNNENVDVYRDRLELKDKS